MINKCLRIGSKRKLVNEQASNVKLSLSNLLTNYLLEPLKN